MPRNALFGSKLQRSERIVLFVVLPLLSVLTILGIWFLLRDSVAVPTIPSSEEQPISLPPQKGAPSLEPSVLIQHLEAAEALENAQSYEEAETAFRAMTETNPESDRAWGGLGRSLLAEKKFQEATNALDRACRANVVEARHFAARGAARRQLNDLKRAIRDYRDALTLKPQDAQSSTALLFIALELNDLALFDRSMEKIREANTESREGWIMAVAAKEILFGDSSSARSLLKQASESLSRDQYRAYLSDRIFASKHAQEVIAAIEQEKTP